jgi:hypothetical protein
MRFKELFEDLRTLRELSPQAHDMPHEDLVMGGMKYEDIRDHNRHISTLHPSIRRSVEKYALDNYHEVVNSHLRGETKSPGVDSHVQSMDHVFLPLKHPAHVYRGLHSFPIHHIPTGESFTEHGYTSTSADPVTARNFAEGGRANKWTSGNGVIAKIHLAPGVKAHSVEDRDLDLAERELILPRGTRFHVLGHGPGTIDRKLIHYPIDYMPEEHLRKVHVVHMRAEQT